ncbi:4-hydroxy-2-oxovalerate aldolase [Aestuariibacter sp. GS-14]|uniref:4-hydroxy-2-oxovalerate aldolase n=1 Tax=Aestuariibacter sp. GS-14 TaxID=2590670 RepID=UPI00112BCA67|nr:4-hydroxy-2-oxovalerate aldolase [Aestuariibacter sp. GS-14]TPV61958.1 4-hydroxy-2-oxovalerate aldolase [Aestuariibacter sp. GS-14]
MPSQQITILDPSLRDGSHAIGHSLTPESVARYVQLIDAAGVDIAEVGHGLGLGASSAQVGFSKFSDACLNRAALDAAKRIKICNFVIPGFATVERDIAPAIEQGISVFRFGTHCTEADLSKRHIQFVRKQGATAMTSLIMSHMVSAETLLDQALKLQDYGASSVTLMDSAGAYSMSETTDKISTLVEGLNIDVGFHGHNNLSLSVANSVIAAKCGAKIVDGTARGFGAGAGNTPIETMVAALHKEQFSTNVDLMKLLQAGAYAEATFIETLPCITESGVISGFYGICGAFQKHILSASARFGVSVEEICQELSNRKAVAGQEDLIYEIAVNLQKRVANE